MDNMRFVLFGSVLTSSGSNWWKTASCCCLVWVVGSSSFLVEFSRVEAQDKVSKEVSQDAGPELRSAGKGDSPETAIKPEVKPITADEVYEFAEQFTEIIKAGDLDGFNKVMDWEGIIRKATADPDSPKLINARRGFAEGAKKGLTGNGSLCKRLFDEIQNDGNYKCIRVELDGDEPSVLFRLKLGNDGGLNFHRLFLKRNPQGAIQISDFYIFLSAERISETLRRGWIPFSRGEMRTPLERLLLPPDPLLAGFAQLGKFSQLVRDGKFEEALAAYRKLPLELQKDKNALLLRMMAAQNVSDPEYLQVIEDFRKYHPKDEALDFILIDAYAIRMNYAKAIECLDKVNQWLDGDGMLLVTRAGLLLALKRVPEARKSIEDAILTEVDLEDAYSVGIAVSLADQNFDETAKYLTVLELDFGYAWNNLRDVPEYAEFVKSPQYRTWASTRDSQKP